MAKLKTKRVLVRVTAGNIADGKQFDSEECPVARTLIGMGHYVSVSERKVRFFMGDAMLVSVLPPTVSKRIIAYDEDRYSMKPFNFYLQVPA